MPGPIEQKAYAGPVATLIGGYAAAILIEAVPWLHDNLTADQQFNLPIIIAFALSAVASYFAPHTHRPDLDNAGLARLRETVTELIGRLDDSSAGTHAARPPAPVMPSGQPAVSASPLPPPPTGGSWPPPPPGASYT